jgi:hypothetical protein
VLAWTRGDELLCAVNFAPAAVAIDAPGTVVLSSDADRAAGRALRELGAGEAVVLRR